jgi:hypothetical protein
MRMASSAAVSSAAPGKAAGRTDAFTRDGDMTDHDDAVAPALFSPDGDIEPFARLLATRIEHARRAAT